MKKTLSFAACLLLLAACNGKPGYDITGTVSNPELNNKYVYLFKAGDKSPLDSSLVKNGSFSFTGSQDTPVMRTICFADDVVKPVRASLGQNAPFIATFVLENGKINITLNETPTTSGTPENDSLTALQQKIKELVVNSKQLQKESKSDNKETADAADEKLDEIDKNVTDVVMAYIMANMNKPSAAKNFTDFRYDLSDEQQTEVLAKADSAFKAAPGVNYIIDNQKKRANVNVGKKFIDFEMADPKGKMHKLSEYVGNGKVVLIDFWASWCPPCRKEMPHLVELYKKYKDKGFEIVGISLDSEDAKWAKSIKDFGITWPQLSDLKGWDNQASAIYGVNLIPETILVGTDGIIIAKRLKAKELDAKLEELLKK